MKSLFYNDFHHTVPKIIRYWHVKSDFSSLQHLQRNSPTHERIRSKLSTVNLYLKPLFWINFHYKIVKVLLCCCVGTHIFLLECSHGRNLKNDPISAKLFTFSFSKSRKFFPSQQVLQNEAAYWLKFMEGSQKFTTSKLCTKKMLGR